MAFYFKDVKPLSIVFISVRLNDLDSLLQEKTFEKFEFFKILKGCHFLLGGITNIHFKPVFRYYSRLLLLTYYLQI